MVGINVYYITWIGGGGGGGGGNGRTLDLSLGRAWFILEFKQSWSCDYQTIPNSDTK